MTYLEENTKYFAPLDEIIEALLNNEGICGLSNDELHRMVGMNTELSTDIANCDFD